MNIINCHIDGGHLEEIKAIARINDNVANPQTRRGNDTDYNDARERDVDRGVTNRGRQERVVHVAGVDKRMRDDSNGYAIYGVDGRFGGACV